MLTALIANILVSLLGWFFTHRKVSDVARIAEENGRSMMAMHIEMGHITAAEKRREIARHQPSVKVPDPRSHLS